MSDIVRASDISMVLQEAKKNGIREVTMIMPVTTYESVTQIHLFGFQIGTVTQTSIAYKSVTFRY